MPRKPLANRFVAVTSALCLVSLLILFLAKANVLKHLEPVASAATTFTVNSTGDGADSNLADGICNDGTGACTLRAAIQQANNLGGPNTITFNLAPASTITLNTALPNIASNLTMVGPGSSLLTIRRSSAIGTPDFRILTANNVTTSFSGLTITNGKTASGTDAPTNPQAGGSGGGILGAGTMTLTDVVITGNTTGNGGSATNAGSTFGAPAGFGGGISFNGTLTLTNVTVSNNTTGNGGNGGFGHTGGRGGGLAVSGTITMTHCSVTGNNGGTGGVGSNAGASGGNGGDGAGIFADTGTFTFNDVKVIGNHSGNGNGESGGGGIGGGIFVSGNASIINSTISNNTTGNAAPGVAGQGGFGGGIFNGGVLTVTGSTISGNSAGNSPPEGEGGNGGGLYNGATMTLVNTTISGNSTPENGSAIFYGGTLTLINVTVINNRSDNDGDGSAGGAIFTFSTSFLAKNSIIAGNVKGVSPSSTPSDIGGFVTPSASGSFNIIGTGGSGGLTNGVNNNQVGVDPLVGPLSDNGGPTQTHELLLGSPAIDAGNNAFITNPPFTGPPFTDQRGSGFNRTVDGPDADATATVDIGAYEKQTTFPDLPNVTGNEDSTIIAPFDVLDPGSITSITATSSNPTLVPGTIVVSGAGTTRVLTITLGTNESGSSVITVTINRTGGSSSQPFNLTVSPVNDVPSFTKGADQLISENTPAQTITNWATNISAGPADEAGQTLTFQVTGNTNPGLFAVAPAVSSNGTLTYTPTSGGSGTATISLALKDNGGTANGGIDTSATQTFTINVQDGGALQFSTSSFTVNENATTATITVTRSGGTVGEATVNYATSDGTATAGQDYTATSGTLIFASGVSSQTFSVAINNDTLDEPTETVLLTLSTPGGSGALGSQSTAQLSIFDNDPTPTLSINDVAIIEGASGANSATFTVTLSAASSFTVTANFATQDSSATAPSDYITTTGQVVFNPGDTTRSIVVMVNGDNAPESHETFLVNLSSAVNASFSDSQGVGTILSDDSSGGSITFSSPIYDATEFDGHIILMVNRTGSTSSDVTVDYATSDSTPASQSCTTSSGSASAKCDYTSAFGTLRIPAGQASAAIDILITQDYYVEPAETLTITLSNPTGGAVLTGSTSLVASTLTITDPVEPTPSQIEQVNDFVRQHYHDFLNREADASGLQFWSNQILDCGSDQQCVDIKRINVSGAFFLSIEFQETGYLAERMYKVSYGNPLGTSTLGGVHQIPVPVIRLNELLADSRELSDGLIVGNPGWEQLLENNKRSFADRFVQRARFTAQDAFPLSLTASQFVDKLNTNAGGVLLPADRIQLINELSTGMKTRAQVVRTIAEDSDLVISERNQAFVLMQYFGYLRRNPNDLPDSNYTGYEFWLNKLNQHAGNFVEAEMVKSFIVSGEYKQRVGP